MEKKYYLVEDFGTMVECDGYDCIPAAFGYSSWEEVEDANGGVMPDIYEIDKYEYDHNDYYDVI